MPTSRKKTRPNHMTPEERNECVHLYVNERWTLDRLAERYDRERFTISQLMRRRGARRKDQRVNSAQEMNRVS